MSIVRTHIFINFDNFVYVDGLLIEKKSLYNFVIFDCSV